MLYQDSGAIIWSYFNQLLFSIEDKADDTKDKFYDKLEGVVNSLPAHCLKMIVGDFDYTIVNVPTYVILFDLLDNIIY